MNIFKSVFSLLDFLVNLVGEVLNSVAKVNAFGSGGLDDGVFKGLEVLSRNGSDESSDYES